MNGFKNASYITAHVENGTTIQMGISAVPYAGFSSLINHKKTQHTKMSPIG
jgi:hypothetical protein